MEIRAENLKVGFVYLIPVDLFFKRIKTEDLISRDGQRCTTKTFLV